MRYYFGILVIVLILFIILAPKACTNESKTTEVLINSGLHPIEVGGYAWFQCGDKDIFATKFKAYSSDSTKIVTGCVCSGLFKGNTIRYD